MNGAARAVLDERGCRKIHEAALTLLEEVGCAVLDPEALALLEANGARVDGERARFGEALVERARSTAPARYTSPAGGRSSTCTSGSASPPCWRAPPARPSSSAAASTAPARSPT